MQRISYKLNQNLEILLSQLANRLEFALKGTISVRQSINSHAISQGGHISIDSKQYPIVQWVSMDMDGVSAMSSSSRVPAWSGRVETNKSSGNRLYSIASNLQLCDNIISNLSPSGRGLIDARVYLGGNGDGYEITSFDSNKSLMNLNKVTSVNLQKYRLAWSSYAIALVDETLYIYYDMEPIARSKLSNRRSILSRGVSSFRLYSRGSGLSFEMCLKSQVAKDEYANLCKERYIDAR